MLFEAGGLDVKDTTIACPHTPNLLTINKIAIENNRFKNTLYVIVRKSPINVKQSYAIERNSQKKMMILKDTLRIVNPI